MQFTAETRYYLKCKHFTPAYMNGWTYARKYVRTIFSVIYFHPEHPGTKPNELKCIKYGRIGPRLCDSVNEERIRGMH